MTIVRLIAIKYFNRLTALIPLQVHLNKLECHGKLIYFSNSTQIVKLVY